MRTFRSLTAVLSLVLLSSCSDDPTDPGDMNPGDSEAPLAVIDAPANGSSAVAGDPVAFDGTSSEDPLGGGLDYSWAFGDGTLGGAPALAHIYGEAGTYTARLIVTDAEGTADTATVEVQVNSPPPAAGTGQLEGLVVDGSGVPLQGASVARNGTELGTTDADGRVVIEGFPTGTPVGLTVSLDGYSSEIVRVEIDEGLALGYFRAGLRPRNAPQALDIDAGGTVTGEDEAALALPAGALVRPDGTPAEGEVDVAITPVDVGGSERDAFPGAFVGVTSDGSSASIASLGVVEYVVSQGGDELQLAPGASAELTLPIYTSGAAVGDSIPLWSLDERTGVWIQEGSGEVIEHGGGLALRASVGHLSWWNVDIENDVIEAYFSCEGYYSAKGLDLSYCNITAETTDDGPAWSESGAISADGSLRGLPGGRTIRFTGRSATAGCILTGDRTLEVPADGSVEAIQLLLDCTEDTSTRIEYSHDAGYTLAAGEVHAYVWSGETGDEVRIDLTSLGLDGDFQVSDPGGTVIAGNAFSAATPERSFLTLGETGDYRITVFGRDASDAGDYNLALTRFLAQPPTALGTLTEAQTFEGSLDFPSDVETDVLELAGTAGGTLAVTAVRTQASPEPLVGRVELVGPSAQVLLSETFTSVVEGGWVTLPETGTYRVELSGVSGVPGDWALRLDPGSPSTLAAGGTVSGSVPDGLVLDPITAAFAGGSEARLGLSPGAGTGRLRMTAFDPAGAELFSVRTDQPGTLYRFIEVPSEHDGLDYRLQVHGELRDETGDYTVAADVYVPDDPVSIAIGEGATGDLGFPSEVDVYTFDAGTGDGIQLTVDPATGSDVEGRVTLEAPSGTVVVEDAIFSSTTTAGIQAVLEETGTYRIEVAAAPDGAGLPGEYELALVSTGGPTPITVGDVIRDAIDFGGEVDRYPFDGTAGDWILLNVGVLPGSELEGNLRLIAPDGADLFADFNGIGFYGDLGVVTRFFELPQTGEYTVTIAGRRTLDTGEYQFALGTGKGRQEWDYGSFGQPYTDSGTEFTDMALDGDEVLAIEDRLNLYRIDAAGQFVSSFGASGELDITATLGYPVNLYSGAIEIQPDGGIVLAGYTDDLDFFVARLDASGAPDTDFGSGGISVIDTGDRRTYIRELRLVDDGGQLDILAVGWHQTTGSTVPDEVFLARLDPDGTPDTSFGGGNGLVFDPANVGSVYEPDMDIQSDGKIVVSTRNVRRYNVNGTLDTTFGINGVVDLTTFDREPEDVVVLNDDRIVLVGVADNPAGDTDILVIRLLADGGRDTGFGDQGAIAYDMGWDETANAVAVDGSGRLAVAGWAGIPGFRGSTVVLLSVLPDGTPESGFGVGGFSFGQRLNRAEWVGFDTQERIMVGSQLGGILRLEVGRFIR